MRGQGALLQVSDKSIQQHKSGKLDLQQMGDLVTFRYTLDLDRQLKVDDMMASLLRAAAAGEAAGGAAGAKRGAPRTSAAEDRALKHKVLKRAAVMAEVDAYFK